MDVFLILFLALCLLSEIHAQSSNIACSQLLTDNRFIPESGRWFSTLKIRPDRTQNGVILDIIFTKEIEGVGSSLGVFTTRDDLNFHLENRQAVLYANNYNEVKLYIDYNSNEDAPKVGFIKLNGQQICKLSNWNQRGVQGPSGGTFVSSRNPNDMECGKIANRIRPKALIFDGMPTTEGDWPWHGALYRNGEFGSNTYICGGSLISTEYFITSAHCVTERATPISHLLFSVQLGKFKLEIMSRNEQKKSVQQIIVHPDYNYTHLSADLAILKLATPVDYTNYVRPVCLWKDTETDIKNVEGRRGSVVGWGINVNGQLREELTLVEMPVIDKNTCIYSYPDFFGRYTTKKSYCAAYNEGTVCHGDSGGGMVFLDSDRETWRLRGIVSGSVPDKKNNKCDPNYNTIFTDVAKFLPWIREQMNK